MTVTFDGQVYTGVLQPDPDYDGVYYIGNVVLSEWPEVGLNKDVPDIEGEDYCFLLANYGAYSELEGYFKVGKFDTGNYTSYPISVTIGSETYHQLDENFIPDTIARKSDLSSGSKQVQADFAESDPSSTSYIKNKPCKSLGEEVLVSDCVAKGSDFYINGDAYIYEANMLAVVPVVIGDTYKVSVAIVTQYGSSTLLNREVTFDENGHFEVSSSHMNISIADTGNGILSICGKIPQTVFANYNPTLMHLYLYKNNENSSLYKIEENVLPNLYAPIVEVLGNKILSISDAGTLQKVTAYTKDTDVTITIPSDDNVAFDVNTEIEITQYGFVGVTIVADSGVTINSIDGLTSIAGRYGSVTLKKMGTNEWLLGGALA